MKNKIQIFINEILIVFLGSFVLSYLTWIYTPGDTVSSKTFVISLLVLLVILIPFTRCTISYLFLENKSNELPKIVKIDKDSIILQKSKLYSNNCVVSLYDTENGFEKYLGYGYVENITIDDLIQIKLVRKDKEIFNKDRKKLLIKPNINMSELSRYNIGENNHG